MNREQFYRRTTRVRARDRQGLAYWSGCATNGANPSDREHARTLTGRRRPWARSRRRAATDPPGEPGTTKRGRLRKPRFRRPAPCQHPGRRLRHAQNHRRQRYLHPAATHSDAARPRVSATIPPTTGITACHDHGEKIGHPSAEPRSRAGTNSLTQVASTIGLRPKPKNPPSPARTRIAPMRSRRLYRSRASPRRPRRTGR